MARMFHALGVALSLVPRPRGTGYEASVALCCLLGACPVFVPGIGHEVISPYIVKPGILIPLFYSMSSVHVRIVQQLLPAPFHSIPFWVLYFPIAKFTNCDGCCTTVAAYQITCTYITCSIQLNSYILNVLHFM